MKKVKLRDIAQMNNVILAVTRQRCWDVVGRNVRINCRILDTTALGQRHTTCSIVTWGEEKPPQVMMCICDMLCCLIYKFDQSIRGNQIFHFYRFIHRPSSDVLFMPFFFLRQSQQLIEMKTLNFKALPSTPLKGHLLLTILSQLICKSDRSI